MGSHMRGQSAFQTLVTLDQYCRQYDKSQVEKMASLPTLSMVRFRLDGNDLATSFDELLELLEVPSWTRLPRVQSWVRGVSNLRGRLLPIIDLAEFLGGSLSSAPKQQRVLVLDKKGIFVGLLVDEVIGMHHFPQDLHVEDVEIVGDVVDYLEGSYRDGDKLWGVFSPTKLISNEKFLTVTV